MRLVGEMAGLGSTPYWIINWLYNYTLFIMQLVVVFLLCYNLLGGFASRFKPCARLGGEPRSEGAWRTFQDFQDQAGGLAVDEPAQMMSPGYDLDPAALPAPYDDEPMTPRTAAAQRL